LSTRAVSHQHMPGPGTLPAIYGFLTNRLNFLTQIAERYGDKVMFNMILDKLYLVTDPDEVRRVLLSNEFHRIYPDALSSVIGNGLLASEGDYWREQRIRMSPYFHVRQLETFSDVIIRQTQQTLIPWTQHAGQDAPMEVYIGLKQLTHRIVMQALFSDALDPETIAEVGTAINTVLAYFDSALLFPSLLAVREHLPTAGNRKFRAAQAVINRTVDRVISQRRGQRSAGTETPTEYFDLMEMLLIAQESAHLTDEQVKDEVLTIFIAGYETTASAIAWTLFLLAKHPGEMEHAVTEIRSLLGDRTPTYKDVASLPFLRQCLDESLRLYPPAWLVGRYPVATTEIGGYRVGQKNPILISPYVIQRRESLWPDANAFHPERFAPDHEPHHRYSYLPFGAGEHICIGQHLALTEAMLILAMILGSFDIELDANHPLERTVGAVLQPKALWLNIKPAS
jgi:cytochrome P450